MYIELKSAAVADAPTVGLLVSSLLRELDPDGSVDLRSVIVQAQRMLGMSDRVWGWLALKSGLAIGVIMLNECAAIYANGLFGEITELYVQPANRSCGVAASLVNAAVDFGRRKGWGRLEVGAPDQPRWSRTRKFYLEEGFVEVGPRLKRAIEHMRESGTESREPTDR